MVLVDVMSIRRLSIHVPPTECAPEFLTAQIIIADTDCIFILQRGGDTPRIEWLCAADAIEPLFRYSYNVRFTLAPLAMQDRARQFRQAARIADTTRVGRLHIPHDRDRLGETVAMVEAMLSGEGK